MENYFSRLALDIIGKAVFNYDFDSLTHDDPVIQVNACFIVNQAIIAIRRDKQDNNYFDGLFASNVLLSLLGSLPLMLACPERI